MNGALRRATAFPGLAAALGAALALLAPHTVISQTDDAATLADFRACGALQRDSARLACFDGVLAADREGGAVGEIAESAPVTDEAAPEAPRAAPEPAETPVAGADRREAAEAPAATAPQAEPAEATAANVEQGEPTEVQPASAPRAPPARTPVASVDQTPIAGDQREAARETQTESAAGARPAQTPATSETRAAAAQTRTAAVAAEAAASEFTVVEFSTRIPGSARFTTDDGRVFVQTSGGSNYRTFPDVPFEATLEDGALGSTFLRLGPRLRVRVRPVE